MLYVGWFLLFISSDVIYEENNYMNKKILLKIWKEIIIKTYKVLYYITNAFLSQILLRLILFIESLF